MNMIILNKSKFHRILRYSDGPFGISEYYIKHNIDIIENLNANKMPPIIKLLIANHFSLIKIILMFDRQILQNIESNYILNNIYKYYEIAYQIANIDKNIEITNALSDQFYWTMDNEIMTTYEQYIEQKMYRIISLMKIHNPVNYTLSCLITRYNLTLCIYNDKSQRFIGKRYEFFNNYVFYYLQKYGFIENKPFYLIVLLKPIHEIRCFLDENLIKMVKINSQCKKINSRPKTPEPLFLS
jgi:hypothetical protein